MNTEKPIKDEVIEEAEIEVDGSMFDVDSLHALVELRELELRLMTLERLIAEETERYKEFLHSTQLNKPRELKKTK